MSDYFLDQTALPYPKTDGRTVPAGRALNSYLIGDDWNVLCAAVDSLRQELQRQKNGVVTLVNGTSASITFATPYEDDTYVIELTRSLDMETVTLPELGYRDKTRTGFTVCLSASFTGTVDWTTRPARNF